MDLDHAIRNFGISGAGVTILTLAVLCVSVVFCAVSTVLWVVLRYRVVRLAAQMSDKQADVAKLAAELEAQALLARQMSVDLEELVKRLLGREESLQQTASAWTGPLNLNRRGQILRLSRKGKSVAEIASDLNVAQGEVELLLKVCDLSAAIPAAEK